MKKRPSKDEQSSEPLEGQAPQEQSGDAEGEQPESDVEIIDAMDLGDGDLGEELDADSELDGEDGDERPTRAAKDTAIVVKGKQSLALRDPLQAYINEARKYPLLSREEEHKLAVDYVEHGNLDAARRLVTANLRLVVKIAHEYRKACRNLLDLVQEGNIGLMHAVKKFDPYRGVKLSSYAAWWIRAYILKYILNNWRLVKIGTTQHQRKLFFNLRKEMDRLQQLGIDNPGPKLLAAKLDVPEHEVRTMQERLAGSDVSLDAPLKSDDGGSATRLDFVTATDAGPDSQVENAQFNELLRAKVAAFGSRLKGRDKEIFKLRTVAAEPLTLQEIGDRYGITRERARQIERRIMDRLRDYLEQEIGAGINIALDSFS